MYTAWIKIDETLPWIELKGKYKTRTEAKKAAKDTLRCAEIRVVEIADVKRRVKVLATKH